MIYQSGEKLKRNKAGFTLLEMITSMSLIVIITTIFIANYRSSNRRTDLVMTAQKLVTDIHMAQNNALGLVKYGGTVPAGGWGIHFDKSEPKQYIMFADLNQPESDDPWDPHSADLRYMFYDEGEGEIDSGARIIDLPTGVEIVSLEITTADDNTDIANVTFLPPDPKTNIFNEIATSTFLRIGLRDAREGKTKTVRVNFLGLVEVID